MKKLALCVVLILALGCAAQSRGFNDIEVITESKYTYDGDLDPHVFMEWEIIDSRYFGEGIVGMWLTNPDKTADIPMVDAVLLVSSDEDVVVIAYRYIKYNIEYVIMLDYETKHYELREMESEYHSI